METRDAQLEGYRREHERLTEELASRNREMTDHDVDSMKQLAELSKKYDERIEHLNREKESEYRRLAEKLKSEKAKIKSEIDSLSRQVESALGKIRAREQQLQREQH